MFSIFGYCCEHHHWIFNDLSFILWLLSLPCFASVHCFLGWSCTSVSHLQHMEHSAMRWLFTANGMYGWHLLATNAANEESTNAFKSSIIYALWWQSRKWYRLVLCIHYVATNTNCQCNMHLWSIKECVTEHYLWWTRKWYASNIALQTKLLPPNHLGTRYHTILYCTIPYKSSYRVTEIYSVCHRASGNHKCLNSSGRCSFHWWRKPNLHFHNLKLKLKAGHPQIFLWCCVWKPKKQKI